MIQVNSLSWRVTSGSGATQKSGRQMITQASLSSAYQEILLGGEVLSSLNLRDTIDSIDQFRLALEREGFSATPVTMPINLDSGASIAGDLDSEKKLRGSTFVMKVAMKRQAQTESY
jgi:ACT domain-containing protein